jgi:hypothetical protein
MLKRLIDILVIFISGVASYKISTLRFVLYEELYYQEWSGIGLIIYPVFITALLLIVYLLLSTSKEHYNNYRWRTVGIICGINVLIGLLLFLGLFASS